MLASSEKKMEKKCTEVASSSSLKYFLSLCVMQKAFQLPVFFFFLFFLLLLLLGWTAKILFISRGLFHSTQQKEIDLCNGMCFTLKHY